MNQRFIGLLAALFIAIVSGTAFGADQPNIVFVLIDDLRWDALSCMGSPVARTPNIDRIAKEGALFKNFFVSIPLCAPSRSSFLTGQYAHTTGVINNSDHSALSHQLMTFPRMLHDKGYESAYVGKWHMGNDATPRPGFDYWVCLPGQGAYINPKMNVNGKFDTVPGYVTDILSEHALTFLKQEHKKPFVLYLAHKAVHGPFTPADRHKNLFENPKFKIPPSVNDDLAGKPVLTRPDAGRAAVARKRNTADSENDGSPQGKFTTGLARQQMQDMASVDEGVGKILEALAASKQLDNTMIVFSSDNGYFWGEHGLGDKRWAYEESIRDPLLIRYPKLIKPGTTFDQLVMNIDIAPTFLELAGLDIPKNVEGKSLVPLLKNNKAPWRSSIFTEYFQEKNFARTPTWQAVRTMDWKYIHYTELEGMDELYRIKDDPYELKNLINKPEGKEALSQLKAQLPKSKK